MIRWYTYLYYTRCKRKFLTFRNRTIFLIWVSHINSKYIYHVSPGRSFFTRKTTTISYAKTPCMQVHFARVKSIHITASCTAIALGVPHTPPKPTHTSTCRFPLLPIPVPPPLPQPVGATLVRPTPPPPPEALPSAIHHMMQQTSELTAASWPESQIYSIEDVQTPAGHCWTSPAERKQPVGKRCQRYNINVLRIRALQYTKKPSTKSSTWC